MSDQVLLFFNAGIAIIGIVVSITWLKFPPVFALLLGTLYLGVTTKLGFEGTPKAISDGFADVMGDIGVLVTFGVILGALLTVTNTMQRLVEAMLRLFGERSVPYVFAAALSSLFSSIYSDVLLVLSAPLARRLGPRMGDRGLALMGGALTAGIEVGLVFVAPGVAAVAIAGILGVPLGQMFLLGLAVGLPTALLTMFVFKLLLPVMGWKPELDEIEVGDGFDPKDGDRPVDEDPRGDVSSTVESQGGRIATVTKTEQSVRELNLFVSITPVLLTLALIAAGALAQVLGWESGAISFITDPIVAIFAGASLAFVLASRVRERSEVSSAIGSALTSCGPILVLSGISGSLGFVIEGSGLADVLGNAFRSDFLPPLLLVWLVAAILHIALGSISVAGITAAGILAPIAGTLGVPVVLVALAAGSGALFLPHVSSNFFWMFQSLLGFSTRGTFKTHSGAMTLASVISLPIILALSAVM
ncbi:gluconate permease [Mycolicibacterium agri]|uniref:Gluconate permease n=1 Tax=Mycolicibacterium agri TaxID=36811 RepID=A0A2A7NCX2_MYCAG|nr:SLC13 family permease [Mycolicibacterium agri]PEG41676.1 gluconate permease [Mycolicibacterium agri]GFG50101.1 gluconate permease [Mycolicibacterium agri]